MRKTFAVLGLLLAGVIAGPIPAGADPAADTQAKLDALPIKGRAAKSGYSRSQFGDPWSDDVWVPGGHNGCDTRNDILREQLSDIQIKPGTNDCVVLSGVLNDPYTGTTIDFHRGPGSSEQVQIDHIVALSDAWQTGAQQLDEATRRNFANDPLNLQATIGWVNHQKGDSDELRLLGEKQTDDQGDYRIIYYREQLKQLGRLAANLVVVVEDESGAELARVGPVADAPDDFVAYFTDRSASRSS